MRVPEIFREFANRCLYEWDGKDLSEPEIIAYALEDMPEGFDILALHDFVVALLEEQRSEAEMDIMWRKLCHDVAFRRGLYRPFFLLLRDTLAARIATARQ